MRADLHIHSSFSDGLSSPEEIVKTAIKKGIGCICIVDHKEVRGAIKAMKFGFDKDILVIPGIEISSASGDILGINVKRIIPDGLSAEKTIREIRKQGGLASIPHAFHWPSNHFLGGAKKIIELSPDAIEVFNASVVYSLANKKAFNFAEKNNFSFTAGSDAHQAEFVGRAYVEIFKDVSSIQEVLEEIKNKRVKIGGNNLNYFEIFRNFKRSDVKNLFKCLLLGIKKRYNNYK